MNYNLAPWKFLVLGSLLALNVSLAVTAGLALFSEQPSELGAFHWSIPTSSAGTSVAASRPLASYSQVLARPIFFKSREPFVPPPPAPPAPPPAPVQPPPLIVVDPGFVLGGIMIIQGVQKAYVFKRTDPKGSWVGAGEDLSGWKVQSINTGSIALRNGDRAIDLELYQK
ncbi:hypothetical protein QMZ05_36980 [Bradyrhizobium sp. INPA03-11B]|uniref:hypothetical protein n=1 Tax=Bradyrhizobium sp. INPA03-11B TaxID=418598 RepID=UPI00338DDE68